jgi:phasin
MSAMNENTKARTVHPAASSTEVPAAMQELADKGTAHTMNTLKNAKAATEELSNLFQHTYTAAAKGVADYNLRVIEMARINTNAAFDYAQELLAAKSPSEFIALSNASTRKHFETMTAQTKELTTLAQKVAIDTGEPLKTGITGAFNRVA